MPHVDKNVLYVHCATLKIQKGVQTLGIPCIFISMNYTLSYIISRRDIIFLPFLITDSFTETLYIYTMDRRRPHRQGTVKVKSERIVLYVRSFNLEQAVTAFSE